MNQFEREEQQLADDFEAGLISQAEYNKTMRDLHRDWRDESRGAAEEAAERAYQNELNRW